MEKTNKTEHLNPTESIVDDEQCTPIFLKDGLNISELVTEGATFEVNSEDFFDNNLPDEKYFTGSELLAHNKISDCIDVDDDDDTGCSPFEKLQKKMENVIPNGKVQKLIKEEGVGDTIPEKALVTIHYNAYLEYQDDPIDSTYLNKHPRTFRLGCGNVLLGIEIAVSSMKLYEISQFVIEPEYAYGELGCLGRIPKNSKLMYTIEVLKVIDSGAADEYEKYYGEDRCKFENAYKVALALNATGNDLFKNGNIKASIKKYNSAINFLERAELADMSEQLKQQKFLAKLYTNLAVCYNKENKRGKACIMCKKVYEIASEKTVKLTAKLFYNHGIALSGLGEYSEAIKKLNAAKRIEPNNQQITNELTKVLSKLELHRKQELKFAQLCISNEVKKDIKDPVKSNLSSDFIKSVQEFCKCIKEDSESNEQYLPQGLNQHEIECFKKEVENFGLTFHCCEKNDKTIYYVSK